MHLKTIKMKTTQIKVALDKKNLNQLNVSLVFDKDKCSEVVYQYAVEDIENERVVNLLKYNCGEKELNVEEIVSKKETKTIKSETDSLLGAIYTAENKLRTKWEYSKILHKQGLKILDKAVPKDTVERTMELTFDFVRNLIDNTEQIESLPENFTLNFVENKEDLVFIEARKKSDQKLDKESNYIYVQVINTFKIL